MHEVAEILFGGITPKTRVWISDAADDAFVKFRKKHHRAMRELGQRLRRYATGGFSAYEGSEKPIRYAEDGVFRIGHPDSQFRILGFYENDNRQVFIAIAIYLKIGQKGDSDLIRRVAQVKRDGQWRRKQDGQFPRMARYIR